MKVTNMGVQVRNPDRVNIFIDGSYRCSLAVAQVVELGVKVGTELDEESLAQLEAASVFGKLYQRALEYCLVRPRSQREVRDYLYKKTLAKPVRNRKTNEVSMREGVQQSVATQVFDELVRKDYVNDRAFAEFWVRNRFMKKGVSQRKLRSELMAKGVERSSIEDALQESDRTDHDELEKMIQKKRPRYSDDTKLMQYLARQGFSYDDIKAALEHQAHD